MAEREAANGRKRVEIKKIWDRKSKRRHRRWDRRDRKLEKRGEMREKGQGVGEEHYLV